jgi:hypothetical protein
VRHLHGSHINGTFCRVSVLQVAGRVAFSYQQSDFVRPISEAQPDISGLQLSNQERAMFLDLGPYVNPSYYVVQVWQ